MEADCRCLAAASANHLTARFGYMMTFIDMIAAAKITRARRRGDGKTIKVFEGIIGFVVLLVVLRLVLWRELQVVACACDPPAATHPTIVVCWAAVKAHLAASEQAGQFGFAFVFEHKNRGEDNEKT